MSPPAAISNSTEKEKQSEDTQTNNDSDAAENAGTSQVKYRFQEEDTLWSVLKKQLNENRYL